MNNETKERESAKSSPCKSLTRTDPLMTTPATETVMTTPANETAIDPPMTTPATETVMTTPANETATISSPKKKPNPRKRRKYILIQNVINNRYWNRDPGPPAMLFPKNTFDYFVERATRFSGDRFTAQAKYDFPARCIYNELAMVLPEYRDFSISYRLRDSDHSTHRVRLIVPSFDRTMEFEHEHEKLSVAEDYAFRVFFLHSCLIRIIDVINEANGEYSRGYPCAYYEYVTPENVLNRDDAIWPENSPGNPFSPYPTESNTSVEFQSGLTGMTGESKESPSTTQDSQLVSVQDVDVVQPLPEVVPDRILSEDVFTDLNLAGVEWWLTRYTWTPSSDIQIFDMYEMLFNAVNSNSAIMKPFQVHAISHLKARILIKPTSNKFNFGYMGVVFIPLWNMWTTDDKKAWLNKYTLSQLPCKYINACSNNEVQLDINFSYPIEYMSHINSPNYLPSKSLGSILLFPLSPLTYGEQGTRSCDLNLFIHFEEVKFGGKIDQRINMQSGLLGIVSEGIHAATALQAGNPDPLFQSLNRVARKFINNKNADHPINPSPGQFVIPQFVPSQSSVTNIEDPVNSFRLNPMGTVTHNYPPVESFEEIIKSPGLFRQVTIQSTDSPSLLTFWCNQPLKPYVDYVPSVKDANRRYVPPLGVVSSFFENYKGSIKYDFMVAMTDKHNVKLMFGVFPTPLELPESVDITYLRNSKFVELNFTDGNFAASVVAPYFNPKKWTRIPSNKSINADCSSAAYTPSYCYLFSISSLSYSTGVASNVQISIFESAGDDFELSVYKSPSISVAPYGLPITHPRLTLQGIHWSSTLTFTPSSLAPGGKPASTDSLWNMWFNNPTSYRAFLVRYSDLPTTLIPIPGYGKHSYGIAYVPLGYNDSSSVIVSVLASETRPVAAVFDAIAKFAAQYNQETFNALATWLTPTEMTSGFTYGNFAYFLVDWTPGQPINTVQKQSGLTGNAGNIPSKTSAFTPTTSRAWGVKDFGEDFSSITNLLKRPYGDVNINIDTVRSANFPNAAFRVNVTPAIPLLDPLPINSIEYDAAASAAEIVLKGFIGFKGSLTLHALFPSTANANVWLNYFPDAYPVHDIAQYPTATANQRLVSTAPKQLFNLGINSAVRTSVPYYSPSDFVLTWTTPTSKTGDNAVISSLGSVVYGLDVNEVNTIPRTMRTVVMKSFGDDAALYLFRGFPPVVFLGEHIPVLARNSTMADIEENPGPSFSRFVHNTAETAGHGFSTGLMSGIESYFSELASTLETTITQKLQAMGVSPSSDFNLSNILTVVVRESGHCILSPTWKTFLWSFAIILHELRLITMDMVSKIGSCLANWFTSIAKLLTQPTTERIVKQGPNDEEEAHPAEFIAILITGISALFGIKEWKDDKNRTAKKFTDTFKTSLQLGTTFTAFVKATGSAFKYLFSTAYFWLLKKHSGAETALALAVTDSLVANWIKEVDFLTDRSNHASISCAPSLQLRVRVAYIIGRRLHAQLILGKDRRSSPLTYYFNQIKKLYEEFAENGFTHHIRREPFVIYVYGKTCIGKSQMQSDLCSRLLASENIVFDGPMTFTIPTISPFMSGLKKQPVIAVDDMMSVIIPDSLRNWFTLVFDNATCASFRPNMAALEEKEKLVENEILYCNSNHEFINHDSITDKGAFHRRFHFKIEAQLIPELAKKHETAKTIDRSILSTFDHLRFRRTMNPHNVECPVYSPWMNYKELVAHAIADFHEFRLASQESVNRRMMCELKAKSLGINDITYDQLQSEDFVETKILEFLAELDKHEEQRGIFSYDFRKMLNPAVETMCDTFKKYYPQIQTPISNVFNRFKQWNFDSLKPEEISKQGLGNLFSSNSPSESREVVLANAQQRMRKLVKECHLHEVLKLCPDYLLHIPYDQFMYACRIVEAQRNEHITTCRCEPEYLDFDEVCDSPDGCFIALRMDTCRLLPREPNRLEQWYRDVRNYVKNIVSAVWDSMPLRLKVYLGILGVVVGGKLISMAYNWIESYLGAKVDEDFEKTFVFQGHYSPGTSSKSPKKPTNIKSNVGVFTSKSVTMQSGNLDDVVGKVRKNLRWITTCPPEEVNNPKYQRKLYPILGLRNREFFVILHYINDITRALSEKHCVTLYDGHIHVPLYEHDFHESMLKWRYTDSSLSELGLWNAPAKVNLVPSIVAHCGSRSKLNRMNNECYIVPCGLDLTSACVWTRFNRNDARFYDDISEYNNLISYDNYSAPGFCGSLVFSKNLSTLVAIHTMGSSNGQLGFGELVFREDLEDVVEVDPGFAKVELESCSQEEIDNFPQYLKILGKIPTHQVKKQASTSVFSLSPLAGTVFEIRKEPGPLTASDPRVNHEWSPMKEGVKKHSDPPKGFDPLLVATAAAQSCELLKQCCSLQRPKLSILSVEEAVLGISEFNFKPLDMSTSPGYPLSAIRSVAQKGKSFLFDIRQTNNERNLIGLHPDLSRILSTEEAQRKNAIACFSPAVDCLKDELLKIEKARRIGGTRVFSVSPVQQVIAGKRLFGDWLMSYRANWFKLEHAISINPHSSDWMRLAQRLRKFPNILEGDFSNFGPQADSTVALWAIGNLIEWCEFNGATEEHVIQLYALREELVNGIHICNNYVYSTISGIISGSFATAEINSEISKIYMKVAWLATTNTDFQEFANHVVLYTYGDDVLMSVSDKYIEVFNVKTISQFLGNHGIKFTNASKTKELIESVTLEEATFLKRRFRFDPTVPNQCLAPLDKVSIEEQLNWVRNSQDPWDLITASTNSMMIEAAMWGQSYYDDLKNKLIKAFSQKEHYYPFVDYHTMIKKIYYKDTSEMYPMVGLRRQL
ncbi:polyprotein [Sassandra virus]|nr:polyprotein [Sassandra virus]